MHRIRPSLAVIASLALALSSGCGSKSSSSLPERPRPTGSVKIDPHSIVFEWQAACDKLLGELASSADFKTGPDGSMFDLRDLDRDGFPELVFSPDSGQSTLCRIYRYSNGEYRSVFVPKEGGGGVCGYIPSLSVFNFRYEGRTMEIGSYCRLKGIDMIPEVSYYGSTSAAASTLKYEIDGAEVTLTKYENALEKYRTVPQLTLGRRYTFGSGAADHAVHYSESWGTSMSDVEKKLYRTKLTELCEAGLPDRAFEFCDLNGDNVPELICSEGSNAGSSCRVYTIADGAVSELLSGIGSKGVIGFDIGNRLVFADTPSGRVFMSLSGDAVNGAALSDSTVELGRKYILTTESIIASLR